MDDLENQFFADCTPGELRSDILTPDTVYEITTGQKAILCYLFSTHESKSFLSISEGSIVNIVLPAPGCLRKATALPDSNRRRHLLLFSPLFWSRNYFVGHANKR